MTSRDEDLNALYTSVVHARKLPAQTPDCSVIDSWHDILPRLLAAAYLSSDDAFEPSWDFTVDLSVAFHYDLDHRYTYREAARLLFRLASCDYIRSLISLHEYAKALCALPFVKSQSLPIQMGAYALGKRTGKKVLVFPEDIPESYLDEYFAFHSRDAFLELWLDPYDQAVYGFMVAPAPDSARPFQVCCRKLLSGSESIEASAFARAVSEDGAAFRTAHHDQDTLVKWKAETRARAIMRRMMDDTTVGQRHKLEWPYDDPPVVFVNGYAESVDRETLDIPGREWIDSALSAFSERLLTLFNDAVPGRLRRLVISPHAFFHLVPLHALPMVSSGVSSAQATVGPLVERCEAITYVPSLKVYQTLGLLPVSPGLGQSRLYGFADVEHLGFASAEALLLGAIWGYDKAQVVMNPNRSNMAVPTDAGIIHFACHARSVSDDSRDTAISLLDGTLARDEILEGADLWGTGLVVLNACATGCSRLYSSVWDEYLGLDGAFVTRGAAQVVSTLWPVSDAVACLFSAHFYRLLLANPDASVCTCTTQKWLREGHWKNDDALMADLQHAWEAACQLGDSHAKASLLVLRAFIETTPPTGLSGYRDWAAWKCTSAYELPPG